VRRQAEFCGSVPTISPVRRTELNLAQFWHTECAKKSKAKQNKANNKKATNPYGVWLVLVPLVGFELTTYRLQGGCSTN
jgi:5-formyltetrahydrofolate cyclo-ligase